MANVLKKSFVAVIFLLATFLALELSLRLYLFGPTGLSPEKVGSFSLIFRSGLVQPAANLDVWYELKPNQDTLFRGAQFRTNSQGLADDDYALEKPNGTIRVAVVGSSWTMGSGVPLEDVYHSVVERQYNSTSGPTRYEFINFGVEFYGLQEIVATTRRKALQYKPDLIVVEITGSTPVIRWITHESVFVPAPRRSTAWDSLVFQNLAGVLGKPNHDSDDIKVYRENIATNEWGVYYAQIERAFSELHEISKANNVPIAVIWLRANVPDDDRMDQWFLRRAAAHKLDAAVINLDTFLKPGEKLLKLLISRVEPHPNALGHELIAGELRKQLLDKNPLFSEAPQ